MSGGDEAWVLAGGMDSFDWLKDRTKRTSVVVDLSQVAELHGIRDANGGFEIGATTTLTEVADHAGLRAKFPVLAEAAGLVASPQIRNQGTLGGNVSQDTRCWYYRRGWHCYRAGGNICYADTPTAINREHAILGADRCVAVSPSDTAPALIALDAQMVISAAAASAWSTRPTTSSDRARTSRRMNVLQPGEVLTAIRIPATWAGRALLFREGPRPRGVGLPAGERRLGDQDERQAASRARDSRSAQWRRGRCGWKPSNGRSPASRSTRRRPRWPASSRLRARSRSGTTHTRCR